MQEVWIDSPPGWLAAVDGENRIHHGERHQIDPTPRVSRQGTIIFYSSGPRDACAAAIRHRRDPQREGPFMEAEVNSPMVELAPGESYAMDTTWYPTRMGEDFKTTTWAGVIGKPLTATATPAGLVLSGGLECSMPAIWWRTFTPGAARIPRSLCP